MIAVDTNLVVYAHREDSKSQVHDARVVALCAHHGVTEFWTADRDFSRFPGLSVRNPLVA